MHTDDRASDFNAPPGPASPPRRRGRPLEMAPDRVLALIHHLHGEQRLFRVHREHPGLYARARRLFGSWSAALSRAGVDPAAALADARRRSVESRRQARAATARPRGA